MSAAIFTFGVLKMMFLAPVAALALDQPETIPNTADFKIQEQHFPPIQSVVEQVASPVPIYGIYTWFGEYGKLREDIRKVGWTTLRIGGPKTDANMSLLFEDGLNFAIMVGDPGARRDAFDSDEAYIEASVNAAESFMDRFGEGGTFYKDYAEFSDRFLPYITLRNEPNFHYMWKAGSEGEREALYARLAPLLTDLIKKRSPKSKVIGFTTGGAGAGDMRFVEHVLALAPSLLRQIDVFSTHPYVNPAPPETDKMEKWGTYSIANSLWNLRQSFAQYGRKDIPVWYTEGGWTISKADGGAYERTKGSVPPNFQAAYSCRYYALALRLGVECVTNMFITDSDSFSGGFFDRLDNMKWRPSAYAVQNMIRLMPHPKLKASQSDGVDDNYIYEFQSNAVVKDSPTVIMAYRNGGPKAVEIKVPFSKVKITDMLGGTVEAAVVEGAVRTEIGAFPIYLQSAN